MKGMQIWIKNPKLFLCRLGSFVLHRLTSEEWHMSIQKVNALFDQYSILKFIEDCYGVFHMEGDYSVFDEIKTLMRNKVDVDGTII